MINHYFLKTKTLDRIRASWLGEPIQRYVTWPVPRPGSHTLRHTCVQRLVDAHFSLKTIGDFVGHGSPDSTRVYSKVDVEALREVALGNGEEVV